MDTKLDSPGIGFIFDHDGVLADTEEINFSSWKSIFELQNKVFTRNIYRESIHGYNSREVLNRMFGNLSEEKRLELRQEKSIIFEDLVSKSLKPISGAIEFVKKAHSMGIKIVIASMAKRKSIDFSIKKFSITNCVDSILSVEDVAKNKPDPEIYLKAINILDIKPENCVVFEDSLAGLESATRASGKVVFVNTSKLVLTRKDIFEIEIEDFENLNPNDIISRLGF